MEKGLQLLATQERVLLAENRALQYFGDSLDCEPLHTFHRFPIFLYGFARTLSQR